MPFGWKLNSSAGYISSSLSLYLLAPGRKINIRGHGTSGQICNVSSASLSQDITPRALGNLLSSPSPLLVRPSRTIPPLHLPHLRGGHILADNLPAEIHKGLVDIGPPPRTRLVIRRIPPRLADAEGARARHGPVFFQVGFVADNDQGNALVVFDAHDLVAELVELGEGGQGGDREDEEEALPRFHVEFSGIVLGYCSSSDGFGLGEYLMAAIIACGSVKCNVILSNGGNRIEDLLNCSVPAVSNLEFCQYQIDISASLEVVIPHISSMH